MNTQSKTVLFPDFGNIEPENLISLTKEYVNEHVPKLINFVKKNEGKTKEISFKRINPNGVISEKIIFGTIGKTNGNHFIFTANTDMNGTISEIPMVFTVRWDNVLGMIPILPSKKGMSVYEDSSSTETKKYFEVLGDMKNLLQKSIGLNGHVKAFYRYNEQNRLYRDGNFCVECQPLKVNNSNFEYYHYKTSAYISKDDYYADILQRNNEVDRFIAPDRYLYKVQYVGSPYSGNSIDDGNL